MSKLVNVKTPNSGVIAGVQDPDDPSWVTVFPVDRKDDADLQGPAVAVRVGDGTPYEIVE